MDSRIAAKKITGRRRRPLLRILVILLCVLLVFPAVSLLLFRFVPVPGTPEMALSLIEGKGAHYQWAGWSTLPPDLEQAVIAAEDENFCHHHGFDWRAIEEAERHNARGGHLRGASTISQQTARTLFLVPWRSWLRKGAEAYLTVMMEALWPKQRILTAYLNLVDWGHGNFGAEAAAQAYFHKPVAHLTRRQAARLAAILPDPSEWKAAHPGPYVARRAAMLGTRMGWVRRDGLDSCLRN